jgi:hypothetical protein
MTSEKEEIEAFVQAVENMSRFEVTDYNLKIEMWEPATATLKLEWTGEQNEMPESYTELTARQEVISAIEGETTIEEICDETAYERARVEEIVHDLCVKGEAYKPGEGVVRST